MEEREKLRLRKLLRELKEIKGRHTELVSVYVPAGFNLVEIINQLTQEKSTAMNIKSKTTRENVLAALEKIISHLRLFKQTPLNGLIIFCGNVSKVEGRSDIKLWSLEPPEKLATKLYWCNQVFVLEPLEEMIREKEVFGLIVLDAREANIGLLRGKAVVPIKQLESTVPSKTVKGGMCVDENSLIQLSDGRIIPIQKLKKEHILTYSFKSMKPEFTNSFEIMVRKPTSAYEIITKEPAFQLVVTGEHKLFVITRDGIEEKHVDELKTGDKLLAIKKVSLPKIHFKNSTIPISSKLCQVLGYMLGDGTLDGNRIILYEKDLQLLHFYSTLITEVLGKPPRVLKRGNTHEIRIYSKAIAKFVTKYFPEVLLHTKLRKIPENVLLLSEIKLAKFVRGLFDAEGYITQQKVVIRLTNENIIRVLQLLLLRFGIVSSITEPDKFDRYTLQITNPNSIENFFKKIGFSSKEKENKLMVIRRKNSHSLVDRVPILGNMVQKEIEKLNLNKQYFSALSMFLSNKRDVSYSVFHRQVILKLKRRLKELRKTVESIRELRKVVRIRQCEVAKAVGCSTTTVCDLEREKTRNLALEGNIRGYLLKIKEDLATKTEETLHLFKRWLGSSLIQTIVKEKRKIRTRNKFFDLYVPEYNCFMVNGIIVHNSQRRFDRIREDALNEFLTKVGEVASKAFLEEKELKGVIVGGPGYIKDLFLKEDYLHYQVKAKLLGVKDTSYTGEYGLEELVDRAQDLLKEASIAKEKELLKRFLLEIQVGGKVSYRIDEVEAALNLGAVDTLLVSDAFDVVEAKVECRCGEKKMKVERKLVYEQVCEKCGEVMEVKEIKEIVDEFIETAKKFGAKVEFISTDTREGVQFKELGGIGALLRYKLG